MRIPAAVLAEATDLATAAPESAVRYHSGVRHLRRWRELNLEAAPAPAAPEPAKAAPVETAPKAPTDSTTPAPQAAPPADKP